MEIISTDSGDDDALPAGLWIEFLNRPQIPAVHRDVNGGEPLPIRGCRPLGSPSSDHVTVVQRTTEEQITKLELMKGQMNVAESLISFKHV